MHCHAHWSLSPKLLEAVPPVVVQPFAVAWVGKA